MRTVYLVHIGNEKSVLDTVGVPGVDLEHVEEEHLFERLKQSHVPEGVLIGTRAQSPIRLAQQIHAVCPWAFTLLLIEPDRFTKVNQMVKISPFLGNSTRCIDTRAIKNLNLVLTDLLARARQRKQFREIVASSNKTLQEAGNKEQQSRKILDKILQHAPVGVLLLDRSWSVVASNKYASTLLEQNETKLIGTNFRRLFAPEDHQRISEAFQESEASGPRVQTLHRRRTDGNLQYFDVSVSLVDNQRPEEGYVVILSDVTEKSLMHSRLLNWTKELEQKVEERTSALRQYSLLLEQKNRDLERYNYIASHDLQEPLRTVTGYLSLIQKRQGLVTQAEVSEYISAAVAAAGRMRDLIRDLLSFSRIGKGRLIEDVDLNRLVDLTRKDLSALVQETGAIVHKQELPLVRGVATELRLLFQNLLSNAMKFRKPGTAPEITIQARDKEDHWQISIADNGIGIEQRFQDEIFLMFRRLHTKSEYEGTGIGLASCRRIVELHGGDIWVQSSPGKGSTFCFTLAKNPPPAEYPAQFIEENSEHQKLSHQSGT